MPRVLITGGSGLLALNWACSMRDTWEVILAGHSRKVDLRGTRSAALALEPADALAASLGRLKPDVVVHAAGLTNVDQCEREPGLAERLNTTLASNVAISTQRLKIKLVHISTDHLFAGDRAFYTEADVPLPLNVYARTKLQAERRVSEENPDALIVRTNFFGWGHRYRQSFSDWIIESLRSGKPITMFDNVYFTPVLADVLAASAHFLAGNDGRGIINLAGDERISKYDFAVRLARVFGLPGGLIQRGKLSRSSLLAERPLDMSLDNARARKQLGKNLGSLDGFFLTLRQQETQGRRNELLTAVTE